MNDPLTELATVPAVPLHPDVVATRGPLAAVITDVLAIPDTALERRWTWLPSDIDEIDVRYGIYRIHEMLESAIAAITYGRGDGASPAARTGDPGTAGDGGRALGAPRSPRAAVRCRLGRRPG